MNNNDTNTNTTERDETPGPWPFSITVKGRDLRAGEVITIHSGLPAKTVAECGTRTVEDCGTTGPHEIDPDRLYMVHPNR